MNSEELRKRLTEARNMIDGCFSSLQPENYYIKSPKAMSYNCVGWVAGAPLMWWEPSGRPWHYWPARGVPRDFSVNTYSMALQTCGYMECGMNVDLEPGFEKAAIFEANGEFSHVARQLSSGEWTSKLGGLQDIEHRNLLDLGGSEPAYGTIVLVLKRPIVLVLKRPRVK